MRIESIENEFTVCKCVSADQLPLGENCFIGITPEEISLVCPTVRVPETTLAREDGWRAFRVAGELDFSLVGILSKISSALAAGGVGIFAVSTYNTDYILTKRDHFARALELLRAAGFEID